MINYAAGARRRSWMRSASLSFIAAAFTAAPAMAQEEQEVTEVVITGSRTIRDGSQAPTPVSVVSMEQLQVAAPKNIVDALQALPALRGTSTTQSTNNSAARNFTGSFMNLRNLGANRTLTLLDGRRVAPATVDGAVNFNNLPQALIKRVDIVTGGASAAYGSDAVAGVVNVILDDAFIGYKGTLQGGISDKGDTGNYKADLSYGGKFMDDRLHIMLSAGVSRSNKMESMLHRRWEIKRKAAVRAATITVDRLGVVPSVAMAVAAGGLGGQFNTQGVLTTNYPGGLLTTASQPSTLINTAFGLVAKTNYNPTTGTNGLRGQGYKILPNGEGSVYDLGDFTTAAFTQGGGDGTSQSILGAAALLEGYQGFGRATFDISENLQLFGEGFYSESHNNYFLFDNSTATGANSLAIFENNYYLQQTATDAYNRLRTIAPTATGFGAFQSACNTLTNGAGPQGQATGTFTASSPTMRCFRMARSGHDLAEVQGDATTEALNVTVGFKAEIFGGYRLSGYYNHGTTDTVISTPGSQYLQRMYAAADVIANPATGGVSGVATGAPVCAVLVYGSTAARAKYAGCQPANFFGVGNVSQAAQDWFLQSPDFGINVKQDVWAADIAGEPFSLPAGDISVAFGIEHRELSTELIGGEPLSNQIRTADGIRGYPSGNVGQEGVFQFTNQSSYDGEVKVNEAYTEVNVPLLRDFALAKDLSLNGAYRYTDYSTSGPVKTWKVGAVWAPSESFRFRGTLSHDIRAPSIGELYQGNVTAGFAFNDIAQTPAIPNVQNARTTTRGNANLVPEEADTMTYGIVFTPTWIPGFTATIDYYDIKIDGAIVAQGGNDPIIDCVTYRIQAGCDAINREGGQATPLGGSSGPLNPIQTVTVSFQNLAIFQTKGWDVEFSYRRAFEAIPGTFNFRTILGYTAENYTVPREGQATVYQIGEVAVTSSANSNPRFRAMSSVAWDVGPVNLQVTNRYTGHAHSATYLTIPTVPYVEGVNIDNNRVRSQSLWDLAGRYRFGDETEYEVFLVINNLLDSPPPLRTAWAASYVTNPMVYDQIGRQYVTGVRFRF